MKLRIEKSIWGDLGILGFLAFLAGSMILQELGILRFYRGSAGWLSLLIVVVCLGCSLPVLLRLLSSAPLVELEDDSVVFFVGNERRERCRIPRSALLLAGVQRRDDDVVFLLFFDAGALRPLREIVWTPYLEVKFDEVLIPVAHVRGEAERIAEAWTAAINAARSPSAGAGTAKR